MVTQLVLMSFTEVEILKNTVRHINNSKPNRKLEYNQGDKLFKIIYNITMNFS